MPLPTSVNKSKENSSSQMDIINALNYQTRDDYLDQTQDDYLDTFNMPPYDQLKVFSATLGKLSRFLADKNPTDTLVDAADGLDYKQLWLFLASLGNVWLYQGHQLITNGIISQENYFYILSLILTENGFPNSCTFADAQQIFFTAHKKLNHDTIIKQFTPHLFKPANPDVHNVHKPIVPVQPKI